MAETDPDLVAMQLDIGWAYVAGQDPIEMFRNIMDVFGVETVKPGLSPNERVASMAFAPAGAHAALAGLKHFAVEQDNAACLGDSLAATRRRGSPART